MTSLDHSITLFVNQFAGRSWLFDTLMVFLSGQDLLKGGFTLSLFWYAWFRAGESRSEDRQRLVSMLAGCFVALMASQILQFVLPARRRPIHTLDLAFTLPHGLPPRTLEGWSSFPSDHAALFFGLSTGLFLVSRPLGLLSFAHTIVLVCFPRLYLGFHFATDLMAGAFLGFVSSYLMCSVTNPTGIGRRAVDFQRNHPAVFYSALFLVTSEFVRLFIDLRELARFSRMVLQAMLGSS